MRGNVLMLLCMAHLGVGAELRIGVFGLFRPERLTVKSAAQVLEVRAGDRVVMLTPGQVLGLRAESGQIDAFAQREMSTTRMVQVSARGGGPTELTLSVPGKIERRFRGRLSIGATDSVLTAVMQVDRELAVASVVAAELPEDAPAEARKLMAVLARSYYANGPRRHAGSYDFCDTTHCQFHRATPTYLDAAEQTSDLVVTYRARPFAPMYSARCGGRTKSAVAIRMTDEPYPYFAVECATCQRDAVSWTKRLPKSVAEPLVSGPSEAERLRITRQFGWQSLPGNNYRAHVEGDDVVFEGRGEGHGVGVCQAGAIGMARAGHGWREILAYYLPNVDVR